MAQWKRVLAAKADYFNLISRTYKMDLSSAFYSHVEHTHIHGGGEERNNVTKDKIKRR